MCVFFNAITDVCHHWPTHDPPYTQSPSSSSLKARFSRQPPLWANLLINTLSSWSAHTHTYCLSINDWPSGRSLRYHQNSRWPSFVPLTVMAPSLYCKQNIIKLLFSSVLPQDQPSYRHRSTPSSGLNCVCALDDLKGGENRSLETIIRTSASIEDPKQPCNAHTQGLVCYLQNGFLCVWNVGHRWEWKSLRWLHLFNVVRRAAPKQVNFS